MNAMEALEKYHEYTAKAKSCYLQILEDKPTFQKRIIEICEVITSYRKAPETCSDELSIPFSLLSKFKKNENPFDGYPCTNINWTIEGEWIECRIEAYFRSELDSSYTFRIPIKQEDYDAYIEDLKIGAQSRKEAETERFEKEAQIKTEQEKALFLKLKQKYEGDV